jgi:site-specific DNA-methyltransferase (adenine-specific)
MTCMSETIGQQRLILGDCMTVFGQFIAGQVDCIITSPPYNLGIDYGLYKDKKPRDAYLRWWLDVCDHLHWILGPAGHFFLNVGASCKDPWIAMDLARETAEYFTLQNHIVWTKSVAIGTTTTGHFDPVNSPRFLNQTFEHIFHFTHDGARPIDRLAIGVPYMDKGNLKRGTRGRNGDIRCRGNSWFLPYATIQSRGGKGGHKAIYPVELPLWCLKLAGAGPTTNVLDPFVGTGTTLVACEQIGAPGIGIELDPQYAPMIRARIEGATRVGA